MTAHRTGAPVGCVFLSLRSLCATVVLLRAHSASALPTRAPVRGASPSSTPARTHARTEPLVRGRQSPDRMESNRPSRLRTPPLRCMAWRGAAGGNAWTDTEFRLRTRRLVRHGDNGVMGEWTDDHCDRPFDCAQSATRAHTEGQRRTITMNQSHIQYGEITIRWWH